MAHPYIYIYTYMHTQRVMYIYIYTRMHNMTLLHYMCFGVYWGLGIRICSQERLDDDVNYSMMR